MSIVASQCAANAEFTSQETLTKPRNKHGSWNNSIEFLMSCVAFSVGFGNVWRFPFTAYENGGGAFLIPYIILLILVGKPFYFFEMILGQFTGKSATKSWSFAPVFTGVGWAQMCTIVALASYYSSLMALTLYYLIDSFSAELPWAKCRIEWGSQCVDSAKKIINNSHEIYRSDRIFLNQTYSNYMSSAEFYFTKVVLKEKASIDDGIGMLDWKLLLCLLGSWICICIVLSRGVKSTGKASYFLAIFPYIVLITLLIRAVTLDGAVNGILFFITPSWEKLLEPNVWYAAVTQCFFSLSVCFGAITTFSSHNDFRHDIYRDALIITSLDTITSMIAGCTIFGILGNLAKELGTDDIKSVVRAGTGLAFISYPDAIAKFTFVPQIFSVLFFVMMFVLGIGSGVGMAGTIISGLLTQFPNLKHWQVVYPTCIVGFFTSMVYVTPGGQFILVLVDYYGTSTVVFILAIFEMTAVVWIYGIENFLDDIEFMLNMKPGMYWKICWFFLTPAILIAIFIYTVATISPLTYAGIAFPQSAHTAGIILLAIGVLQIPLWSLITIMKSRHLSLKERIAKGFSPSVDWGPSSTDDREEWLRFKEQKSLLRSLRTTPRWLQILQLLFNINPNNK